MLHLILQNNLHLLQVDLNLDDQLNLNQMHRFENLLGRQKVVFLRLHLVKDYQIVF